MFTSCASLLNSASAPSASITPDHTAAGVGAGSTQPYREPSMFHSRLESKQALFSSASSEGSSVSRRGTDGRGPSCPSTLLTPIHTPGVAAPTKMSRAPSRSSALTTCSFSPRSEKRRRREAGRGAPFSTNKPSGRASLFGARFPRWHSSLQVLWISSKAPSRCRLLLLALLERTQLVRAVCTAPRNVQGRVWSG